MDDYVDIPVDEMEDENEFSEGNYNEYCYQMTGLDDDIPDSIVEETDADKFILTDALADKFTEGNFMGDSDEDDDEDIAETVHEDNTNNDDEFTAGNHVQMLNDDENDENDIDADPVFSVDDKTSMEETEGIDKDIDDDVEYFWSDDDEEIGDHCVDDTDNEVMVSLMTTNRQDLSVILSEAGARRRRQEIFPKLCSSCKEIVKYFPIQEADTGMLFPTESDIVSQTDSDYFDRQKCDSQSRHEMPESARGNQNDTFQNGARENHFCYQIASKNQTPTVQMDFCTQPNSRASFSIHSCPDTGATKSIIKASIVRDKKLKLLPSGDSSLRDAQGVYMKVEGKVRVYVSIRGGKKLLIEAIVSSSLADNFLLCWRDQKRLGILPNAWPYPPGSDHWVRIATEGWMSTNSPELSRQMSDSGLEIVGTSAEIQGLQRKVDRMVREDDNPPITSENTTGRPEIAATLAEMLQRDTWPP